MPNLSFTTPDAMGRTQLFKKLRNPSFPGASRSADWHFGQLAREKTTRCGNRNRVIQFATTVSVHQIANTPFTADVSSLSGPLQGTHLAKPLATQARTRSVPFFEGTTSVQNTKHGNCFARANRETVGTRFSIETFHSARISVNSPQRNPWNEHHGSSSQTVKRPR